MKKFTNKFKIFSKKLSKDQSGQGATEYILLLVVVVALVLLFKDKVRSAFSGKLEELSGSISTFKGE